MAKTTTTTKKSTPKTKKSTPKKTATSSTTSRATLNKTQQTPLAKLKNFNLGLSLIYLVQAVVLIVRAHGTNVPVVTQYITTNSLAPATGGATWVAATRHLFDLNMTYVAATLLLVPAVMHFLLATILRARYERDITMARNKVRWIGYAISGTLSFIALALISGTQELATLILISGLSITFHLLCYGIEVLCTDAPRIARRVYAFVSFTAAVTWVALLLSLYGQLTYGEGSLPKYIYAAFAAGLIMCGAFAYLSLKTLKGKWRDYITAERTFAVVQLLGIAALAWLLFAGLLS